MSSGLENLYSYHISFFVVTKVARKNEKEILEGINNKDKTI